VCGSFLRKNGWQWLYYPPGRRIYNSQKLRGGAGHAGDRKGNSEKSAVDIASAPSLADYCDSHFFHSFSPSFCEVFI